MKAKVIVATNEKGGVGKSLTAKSIAYLMASEHHLKTLIIDLDPQCNTTHDYLPMDVKKTITDIGDDGIKNCIQSTEYSNLSILPGSRYLGTCDFEQLQLKQQLTSLDEFDIIVFDTSPYFNELVQEALQIADLALIVSPAEEDAIDGVMNTIHELKLVNGRRNFSYRILLTKVEKDVYGQIQAAEIKRIFNRLVLRSTIRYNSNPIRRARSENVPLCAKYPHSKATLDYKEAAKELMEVLYEK